MFLADADIRHFREIGALNIEPWTPDPQLQAASYDLTLGRYWRFPHEPQGWKHEMTDEGFLLPPGAFILLHTAETVTLGSRTMGFVCGKSSRAREGWQIESAGLVDPGFSGELVLEVKNLLPNYEELMGYEPDPRIPYQNHLRVKPGMKIAQIYFGELRSAALRPYGHPELGSHYQHQEGPVGSRG